MKLKKFALVLAIILVASTFAPAFAKGPFTDVDANHWAYDSIAELAATGLIEGYPDGTFGGQNTMTRYEAAMVFARALTRLETHLSSSGLLSELDKIKAEIVEEVLAQAGGSVETTIVERVVVDGGLDEEVLARLRDAEMANEAIEGDVAYLEARLLGLVDGIRYDVNRIQEQLDAGVEPVGIEELEEMIAAKVQEVVLEAALGTKETVIVQEVIERAGDGLTEEDVEEIAENAILNAIHTLQLDFYRVAQTVGEHEKTLKAHEAKLDELAADVKDLQRVQLSGSFNTTLENEKGEEYKFEQKASLSLNIKASDKTSVKATVGGTFDPFDKDLDVDNYRLEVDSETPITKFIAGKLDGDDDVGPRYNGYVFGGDYDIGGIADIDVIKNLTANILVGSNKDEASDVDSAIALTYGFSDALGLKADLALSKEDAAKKPGVDAFGLKVFGDIGVLGYEGNFAVDRGADEENSIFDVSANAEVAFLKLDGKFISAQDNYGISDPFALGGRSALEAGAGLEFLGIDLGGRYYTESKGEDKIVNAAKVDASRDFDLGLTLKTSAGFVWNKKEADEDAETQITAKASLGKEADLGLSYGAGLAYDKNYFNEDGNWKNGDFSGKDKLTLDANLGYKFDWKTALVSLGYDLEFGIPLGDENADDKTAKHELSLGYDFTDSVGLTAATIIDQVLSEPATKAVTYKAGFSVEF